MEPFTSSIPVPKVLGLIAGRGDYPLQLARSAHAQGVEKVVAFAFRWETSREIERAADETVWLSLGQLRALLDAIASRSISSVVMAGQIKPTRLFSLRLDSLALSILKTLPLRNAHTIFGAIGSELAKIGATLLPAHCFMEAAMPPPGLIAGREPTAREWNDIRFGAHVAKVTSSLEIGQTVIVKEGTVLAVEDFGGTDATIKRAKKLSGPSGGAVVVKVAKQGHDMRFDIPIVGPRTFKFLASSRISCLAVEARRTILLERDWICRRAERLGMAFVAFDMDALEPPAAPAAPRKDPP